MNEFSELLLRVNRIPGVRGSMVVAAQDGLIVKADLMIGVPGPVVAALAASLFARARRSLDAAALGSVCFLQVEAEQGLLFVVAPPREAELVLVVVAEAWVNVGLVRVETGRMMGALG
jgi:predicted regulator of Ras-like GTPase activity (Roadblock/LC7/MglB family)